MSTPQDHNDARLAGTVETMRWLHATAQAQPDATFVDQLERQLMPPLETTRSHAPKSRHDVEELPQPGVRLERPPAPRRTNAGWMYRFASFALVLALIGGTVFALTRFRNGGEETPSTYTAFGAGNLETPTPTVIEEPTGAEWRVSTAASEAITADEYGRTGGIAIVGTTLIRAWQNHDAAGIEALSTVDGAVLWSNDTEWRSNPTNYPGAIPNYEFQTDDRHLYVLKQVQPVAEPMGEAPPLALAALDIETGNEVWVQEFDGGVASFAIGPAGLFVQNHQSTLLKLDPATGESLWTYVSDSPAGIAIAPYVSSDTLITVTGDGVVASIDPESGELIWEIETGLPGHSFSIAEGTTESGANVVAIRGVDQLQEEIEGQRFDEQKSQLMAVDRDSGDVLWSQILNDPSKGQMQIANGMIYATTSLVKYAVNNDAGERIDTGFSNWLVAIDLETGDEIWSIQSDPAWGMAFELFDDTLIMYRAYGAFVTVDLNERVIACDAFTPSGAASDDDDRSPEAGTTDNEMLYLSLRNGEVMAVDPGDWTC